MFFSFRNCNHTIFAKFGFAISADVALESQCESERFVCETSNLNPVSFVLDRKILHVVFLCYLFGVEGL